MVNTKRWMIAGLVAVVAVVAVLWLMPNEDKKVRRQFARLSEWVGKDGSESVIVMAARGKQVAALLADPCELKGSIPSMGGTYSRQEAAQMVAGIRSQFDRLSLDFADLTVTFPETDKARVTLTATLSAARGGETMREVRELDCTLVKRDGAWLFSACQAVDVFQK